MKISKLILIFCYVSVSFGLIGQTLDGARVYLDSLEFIDDCRSDSLVFNKTLNQVDTFRYCHHSVKQVFREVTTDSLYDIQIDDISTGYTINGHRYGKWLEYKDIYSLDGSGYELFSSKRSIWAYLVFYFNDLKLISSYYVSSFLFTEDRKQFNFIIEPKLYDKATSSVRIECLMKSDVTGTCKIINSKDKQIKEFDFEFLETVFNLVVEGYYDRDMME